MKNEDLDALEAAARAATPGKRMLAPQDPDGPPSDPDGALSWIGPNRLVLANKDGEPWRLFLALYFESRGDVEFIAAASPDVVLALVSELRAARARADAAEVTLGVLYHSAASYAEHHGPSSNHRTEECPEGDEPSVGSPPCADCCRDLDRPPHARRFRAWVTCSHVGGDDLEVRFDISADASEEDIEAAGQEAIESLIENFDSGWEEITDRPKKPGVARGLAQPSQDGASPKARCEHDVAQRHAEPCPGAGRCHGAMAWCAGCGDVRRVCDDGACDWHAKGGAS